MRARRARRLSRDNARTAFSNALTNSRQIQQFSADPPRRFARHMAGDGARIVRAARDQGIPVALAGTWPGDRRLERKLKRRHDAPRWCPVCRGEVAG
jgi:hypothetical protein